MKEQRASHRANVSLFSNRLLTSSLPRLGGLPLYVGPCSWGKLGCLASHRLPDKFATLINQQELTIQQWMMKFVVQQI
ncbi:hypothetical protein E2320_021983 [Naja naja]|nr:hypothetical protein E2320_021983 [Naja naja]